MLFAKVQSSAQASLPVGKPYRSRRKTHTHTPLPIMGTLAPGGGLCLSSQLPWETGLWRKCSKATAGVRDWWERALVLFCPLTFDLDRMKGNPTLHLRKSDSSSSQEMPISSWKKIKSINRWASCRKTDVWAKAQGTIRHFCWQLVTFPSPVLHFEE